VIYRPELQPPTNQDKQAEMSSSAVWEGHAD